MKRKKKGKPAKKVNRLSVRSRLALAALLLALVLLGGLCGVARSLVVAVLLLCIVPPVVSLFAPELMQELLDTSTLYSFVSQMDFLNVAGLMTRLVG